MQCGPNWELQRHLTLVKLSVIFFFAKVQYRYHHFWIHNFVRKHLHNWTCKFMSSKLIRKQFYLGWELRGFPSFLNTYRFRQNLFFNPRTYYGRTVQGRGVEATPLEVFFKILKSGFTLTIMQKLYGQQKLCHITLCLIYFAARQ